MKVSITVTGTHIETGVFDELAHVLQRKDALQRVHEEDLLPMSFATDAQSASYTTGNDDRNLELAYRQALHAERVEMLERRVTLSTRSCHHLR